MLFPKFAEGQIKYSFSLNYIYATKWNHWILRNDDFYYFDVPRNHTGSIQGEALINILQLKSDKVGKFNNFKIGFSSEIIYLPFSGLHYIDYTYLGKINGLDQWLHHYDHDRYQFIHMVNGVKVKCEIKIIGP